MAKHIIYALQASLLILSCANVAHAQVPQVPHVLIVLEENTDYADVCGPNNTSMPFLCGLKSKGSFSANYYAPTHPSIGNYEDLGWGVVTTNDDNCNPNTCGFPYTANNIVRATQAAGKSWKGYAESLPANCYFGGDNGNYAVHHSPIPYISEVQSNCQNRYVAFEDSNLGFIHDVASNTVPNFSFITPNMCDDAHDCGLDVADNWLKNNVLLPLLNSGHLDSATGDTVVIVVFDESGGDNTHGGGKVFWFMIGKNVKQNYQSAGPSGAPGYYSHGSSLRVIAQMLGLSLSGLGGAATAPDMAEFFGTTTNSPPPVAVLTVTPQGGIAPVQVTADSSASSDSNGGITSRRIDFGDGTTSTNVTATHTYNSGGTFTVTLSITDNLNLTSTASDTVTVQSAPQPISVSVSPTSATLSSGDARQFAATVANTTNQAVIWTATAGAISSSGLFTAPVVSTSTAITVTATSVAAPSKGATATITVQPPVPQPISVSISPTSTTVASGGALQFTATVANTSNQAVAWTTTAGAISGTGLLTAPVVSTSTTIFVTASSVAAPSKSASATVTVQTSRHNHISVAVSPVTATVSSGNTQQFTATVTNTANQAVTWKATAGTISGAGLFTAPVVSTNTAITVTATSVVATSRTASATVTVQPSAPQPISVVVSPTLAALSSGGTKQFTATVANATNEVVTWTATAGTILPSGLFTAPAVSTTTTITVRASSVAAPSATASANVTVTASAPPISSSAQSVQHNSGFTGSASSLAVTFKSSVTAGHMLLVAQSTFDGETLIAPADSQNNVFAQLVTGRSPGDSVAAIYIATAKSTGPDTVTCKIGAGASDNIHCHIYEVSGTTAVVDAVGSAMQTGKSLSVSTSKATANANDYVFAYFSDDVGESTYLAGSGLGDTEQSVSSSLDSAFSEDKLVTATGIQTATATGSIADPFVELIVALKNSQATVVTPTPPSCTLAVSPASGPVPLNVNASATCTDPQNNLVSTVITWGDGSSINAASGSHTYANAGSFAIKVTAADSTNLSGSATQMVNATTLLPLPSVSVSISPASATVSSSGTQLFSATVANTTNQTVSWTATAGAISAGLFTAPVVSTKTTVTVTASSLAVPSQTASATVQILPSTLPAPAPLTPSGPIQISGQNGTVVENLHITNPSGDCVVITNSTNVIIRRSEIGPCGGHGVKISGGNTTGIYDSYIHPEKPLATDCCDTHDGIFANKTSNLAIQGNVIAYGESNIEITNSSTVTAIGNLLLNPIDSDPSQPADGQSRGQNFQAWGGNSGITVENNYALSSTDRSKYSFPENQEDSINFGLTNGILVQGNYITGGHSPSGCGVIADDASNSAQFLNNRLLDTGQCGLSIASGTNQVVGNNRVLNRTPVTGGGNTAIMVWNQYSSACGPVAVSGNIATESKPDGSQSGFWNGGGCGTVSATSNTFDSAALSLLTPPSTTMPAPPIPPLPKDCVVVSPFTNNTSLLSCSTK